VKLAGTVIAVLLAAGCNDEEAAAKANAARIEQVRAAEQAIEDAKAAADAKAAQDAKAAAEAELAAQEAERAEARKRLEALRREPPIDEERRKAARKAAAKADRKRGPISKECVDNPLAKGC